MHVLLISTGLPKWQEIPAFTSLTENLMRMKCFRSDTPLIRHSSFLLDENGVPAEEGEICVAGDGLALGYYKDEEKTNAVFKEVCFESFCGRIYHSGDYGRINGRGEYICIARKDTQIKHMGHRIELGDIEVCASALDYVDECCCLYAAPAEKIVLFCSCAEENRKRIRKDLAAKL